MEGLTYVKLPFSCGFETGVGIPGDFTKPLKLSTRVETLLAGCPYHTIETPEMYWIGPDLSVLSEAERDEVYAACPHMRRMPLAASDERPQ
jgi:hypothetical protein